MSNIIKLNFYLHDAAEKDQIISAIYTYCSNCQIFVHFQQTPQKKHKENIVCYLSDDADMKYSNYFMAPIIYTMDGTPYDEKITEDSNILLGLVEKVFEFDSVNKIELRLSFLEVNECEYKVYETNIYTMNQIILFEYLTNVQIPVIKLIIYNS